MSVFSNVIKPQGLEPLQFPTKFRSHSVLRKHGYPPDEQEAATRTVLEQAAVLSLDGRLDL